MNQCQFGAQFYSSALSKVYIDPTRCFGCGVCRVACPNEAITLIPRQKHSEAANIWLRNTPRWMFQVRAEWWLVGRRPIESAVGGQFLQHCRCYWCLVNWILNSITSSLLELNRVLKARAKTVLDVSCQEYPHYHVIFQLEEYLGGPNIPFSRRALQGNTEAVIFRATNRWLTGNAQVLCSKTRIEVPKKTMKWQGIRYSWHSPQTRLTTKICRKTMVPTDTFL